ncbi:MAG: SH3 domain-containing protein, partial [Candidatus Sumerlaeales bacterium]|nr:SH3 domain-containing protein [Candidatus Sumerlaeales bacterium]
PGMVLFIVAHDGGEPAKYRSDGLGNASHIGWYTGGMYKVVHSSATRGQVAASTLANGWTHAGYLKALAYNGAEEPVNPEPLKGTAYINLPPTSNVFHRIKPSKSSPWWGRINGGEAVEIVSDGAEWTRVRYGGHDGYVMSKFITTDAQPDPISGGTTPPTLPQVDLIAARLNALKTQINAIAGMVDELIGLIPKG